MPLDRRLLLAAGLGVSAATSVSAALAGSKKPRPVSDNAPAPSGDTSLVPDLVEDQTQALQRLIDESAARKTPLNLPAGRFRVGHLQLRPGSRLIGAAGATILEFSGGPAFLTGVEADGIVLEDLALDGALLALDPAITDGLVSLRACSNVRLRSIDVTRSLLNAISLVSTSGEISHCHLSGASLAGLRSIDGGSLDIAHNHIWDCGNNGLQVWRTEAGEDGATVSHNRIERISARAGGSGENGNGISLFRAASVLVMGNHISDCAYSAVRANSSSNCQMIANACERLGEVALYAEFGFEGAVISANRVDSAASGIEVTNFKEGGRLAVIQGNLVRNLVRRKHEEVDKRGDGIFVEADAAVTGNVVEGAANAGIVVGWGPYLRDVLVSQNLIRASRYGILVSSHASAGAFMIASNMISGARDGSIRAMDHGAATGPDLAETPGARSAVSGNIVT